MSDNPAQKRLRVAVYTSVFGGFEKVWSPVRPDASHTNLLVTDASGLVRGWTVRRVDPAGQRSPRLSNRREKILFHEDLGDHDYSVYIDANVRPTRSLQPLFEHFIASGADIGLYPHYARSSVSAEAQACLARAKVDDRSRLKREFAFYKKAGFPDESGMWEGSVIFKNHRSPRLSAAMHEWWGLYRTYELRDQFSLPFVIWKHGLTVANLDQEENGREHYFIRLQHSSRGIPNRLARYFHARSVENGIWETVYRVLKGLYRTSGARL